MTNQLNQYDRLDVNGANKLRQSLRCDADGNPMVLARSNPSAWPAAYPDCDILNGDINGDGTVGFDDSNPFVALLSGGG